MKRDGSGDPSAPSDSERKRQGTRRTKMTERSMETRRTNRDVKRDGSMDPSAPSDSERWRQGTRRKKMKESWPSDGLLGTYV